MTEYLVPLPLSHRGQRWAFVLLLGVAGMWLLGLYAYQTLPEQVPVHFGWKGTPTRYGDKTAFAFLPFAFSIAPIVFFLITRYRFTLINRYPYLINLPAFYTSLWRLPPERRSLWVNRYFEGILGLGAFLSLYLLGLEYGIYMGTKTGHLPLWFTPVALVAPLFLLIPWVFYLVKLSREMAQEAERYSSETS